MTWGLTLRPDFAGDEGVGIGAAYSILGEGALSFLGLGIVAPQISWGLMLAEGRSHMVNAWWVAAFPGLAMSFVVLAVNLLGDKLRSAYDPRLQRYGYGK